jgi:hypothetical protein
VVHRIRRRCPRRPGSLRRQPRSSTSPSARAPRSTPSSPAAPARASQRSSTSIITSAALWYSPDGGRALPRRLQEGRRVQGLRDAPASPRKGHRRRIRARVRLVRPSEAWTQSSPAAASSIATSACRIMRGYRRKSLQGGLARRRRHAQDHAARLLIVDEFQEFFVAGRQGRRRKRPCFLDRLVRQGRAFGVHVISGLADHRRCVLHRLARSTIGQMAVRVALQCSEADAYLIMGEDNAAARDSFPVPGEAIYNDASGLDRG